MDTMIKCFDHATFVVTDTEKAKAFFKLLGFEEASSVTISGEKFSNYMAIEPLEAEHVTLILPQASPRVEIQLLEYHRPIAQTDPLIACLDKLGFNHLCFKVENLEEEVARLKKNGVRFLNEIMTFHNRKLVFFEGPEGITLELAEWLN
jgi:catechol 2,3-dioxygenase-like lactoylglutathione lyase family enzyme